MAERFFDRWSQRKQAVRAGRDVAEPAVASPVAVEPEPVCAPVKDVQDEPLPTLQDVHALTPDSNFARFVGRAVNPDVRHAALRKLFSDPHFNVMDKLDIYVDDYSLPSPLPLAAVQQMTSAQFLQLVNEPQTSPGAAPAPANSGSNLPEQAATNPSENHHEHIDLRLQSDHAAVSRQAGRSTE